MIIYSTRKLFSNFWPTKMYIQVIMLFQNLEFRQMESKQDRETNS